MEQELKGAELMHTTLLMLMGKEGVDWSPYGVDGEEWWSIRLWTRRN